MKLLHAGRGVVRRWGLALALIGMGCAALVLVMGSAQATTTPNNSRYTVGFQWPLG